jgi:hypothetical protein
MTCGISQSGDLNCKIFDTANPNYCTQCYVGYISVNGRCLTQNPLCNTIDTSTGACLTCWSGYFLYNGACMLPNSAQASLQQSADPYCTTWTNGLCSQCSTGFYYNNNQGKCQQQDPLCRTFDTTSGNCLSCYSGYTLNSKLKCQVAQKSEIANCHSSSKGLCVQCSPYFYLNNGKCLPVSILCLTYDNSTGQCTSCPNQYYLQNGTCSQTSIWDDNCITYQNSYCSQCKQGYYLLTPNYTCKLVDPFCLNFNYQNSNCIACNSGKRPFGPNCL